MSNPETITPDMRRLEELIDADFEIVKVPVYPMRNGKERNCYENVNQRVKLAGGRIQFGWTILQNEFICEAVHHAVWENKAEQLIDVTPYSDRRDANFFIPDDRLIYVGHPIDNIRLNISGNPVVDDFISVVEFTEVLLATTERVNDERVVLGIKEAPLYHKYIDIATNLIHFANDRMDLFSPCYCQSGVSYQDCHRKIILGSLKADKLLIPDKVVRLQLTKNEGL